MNITSRRDYSLDFIKGVSILSVILQHNLPLGIVCSPAWIDNGVPFFLMVSGYLTYASFEKGKSISDYYSVKSSKKVFNRIFTPFIVVTIIQFSIFYYLNKITPWELIVYAGIGPGSYYPWLYAQTWLFLPFIILIINKLTLKQSIWFFIGLSAFFEFATCIINVHPLIYRLLFYRYLFAIIFGCLHAKYKFKITTLLVALSVFSLAASLLFFYSGLSLKPFFTNMWPTHHWITYFYTIFIFILLQKFYNKESQQKIKGFFVQLGNYSYEIFLCQMVVFSFIERFDWFDSIENIYFRKIVFISATTILSIAPIIVYKIYIKPLLNNKTKQLAL